MAKQDVTVELFYGSVWNDHTSSALVRDPIQITRGRSDEAQQPPPTKCSLTFTTWRFNPDNVTSDLFGLIGRNTPIRVTVGTDVRFVGEVASWTPRQSLGGPNIPPDRWVEVTAAGITRRLGQGQDPLLSAPRRFLESEEPAAYWPLDAPEFANIGQPAVGSHPWRPFSGSTKFGQDTLAPWLGTGASIVEASGTMLGDVDMSTISSPVVVSFARRAEDGGSGPFVLTTRGNTEDGGNVWIVTFTPPDTIDIQLNHDGSFVFSDSTTDTSVFDGDLHVIRFSAVQDGSDIDWTVSVDGAVVFSGTEAGESVTGIGRVEISYTPGSQRAPMVFGHVAVWGGIPLPSSAEVFDAVYGHQGEHAGNRIQRLTTEESITFASSGDLDDTVPVGPQYPDGFVKVLREAAGVDLGDLLDSRTVNGILYRTHRRRYNQTATLALDYAAAEVAPPLDPVVDDQGTRNDVTATRRDGGEQRKVDTDGPLGVDTVGRYNTSITVNTLSDGFDLASQAGWRLHLGTIGGTRFPKITVDLDASPGLAAAAGAVDAGDLITVANLPDELTPDLARLLALGYTETIGSHRRRITFNCQPEEPYHIAEVEHADYSVIGSSAATLNVSMNTTETGAELHLGAGSVWVHEADYDVVTGGERMTVTGVSAASGTFPNRVQTLTVTRSVNGVVKAHAAGQRLRLFHQAYIGL